MLLPFSVLGSNPRLFVLFVIAIAISFIAGLAFHEFSHAVVGDALGDPTPRRQGRLTLNPREHLDPLGSLMLVLAGFGWAKPVQINPFNLRLGPRLGMAVVAVAGPLSNFALAAALAVPLKSGMLELMPVRLLSDWSPANYAAFLLLYLVDINVLLGVFNLIPIPPMDGSRLAMLLPGEIGDFFQRMERGNWGFGILFLLLALPFLTGGQVDILSAIINPITTRLLNLFLGG
jgi:Zn-dependent protease